MMKLHSSWKARFFLLWGGQAISLLSSSVVQMALIWHLSAQTKSAAILSLASITGFLPMAVLGLFAGTLVDRWNRKRTLIVADLAIAAVSLVLAISAFFTQLPVWLVLVVLFLRSIGTAFHTPAISAVTPLLVPQEQLTKCSGYTQTLQSAGFIVGTALAAVLYPVCSIGMLVLLDVVGALIACLCVAALHIPQPKAPHTASLQTASLLREMKEGYAALRADRSLFALLWIGAVFMVFYSPVNALFPLLCMDYFGGTTTHASVAEIAFAIGMLLGGVVLGAWGGFRNRGASMLGAMLLMGSAIALSGLLPPGGFWVFAGLSVLMGLSTPFFSGPQTALMQERVPPHCLGRVFGLYGSVMSFAMPLGLVFSGLFGDALGVHRWFFLSGAACVLLTAVAACLPQVRNPEKTAADGAAQGLPPS